MPCSPGMTKCRPDCAHRRFVLDYARERHAQAIRAERASGGNATELAEFYGAQGAKPAETRVLFRDWLRRHAGADYPYPSIWGLPLTLDQGAELEQWIRAGVDDELGEVA